MAQVQIDVDLDEFDTDELIDELHRRLKSKWTSDSEKKDILAFGKIPQQVLNMEVKTVYDQLKLEHVADRIQNYSLEDLQRLLP